MPGMELRKAVLAQSELCTRLRRELHQIPELSCAEFQTQRYICAFLEARKILYRKIRTGVVAEIPGKNTSVTVGFRADTDALPIEEKTDVPYRSVNGNMHACGHDGHTAILLTFCDILSKKPPPVSVRAIFQFGEEGALGAESMIEEGALSGVSEIYALHLDPALALGEFAVAEGAMMAGAVEFRVQFFGKESHCAEPEKGIDALKPLGALLGVNGEWRMVDGEEEPGSKTNNAGEGSGEGASQITNADKDCAVGREPGSAAVHPPHVASGDGAKPPPYAAESPSSSIHDSRFTIHSPTPHSSLLTPNSPPSSAPSHPPPIKPLFHVGKITGGSARNVVAGAAEALCTLRYFEGHGAEMARIAEFLCRTDAEFGTAHRLIVDAVCPPLHNAPVPVGRVKAAAPEIRLAAPRYTAEDFACYTALIPGCLTWLGIQDENFASPLHSDTFGFSESALLCGVELFMRIAEQFY